MAGSGVLSLKLWIVLFVGWLFWFLFFLGPVNGATVTIARDVVIGGPYGQLTAQTSMDMATFTTYANGTIFFDIQTYEHDQRVYQFNVQSYGNGTLQIRFRGERPGGSVASQAATNAFATNPGWQQVTYTANIASDTLIISFLPSVAFSTSTAAYMLALFMGLIAVLAMLNRMHIIGSHREAAGPLTFTEGLQYGENRAFTMIILLVIVTVFIVALFATMFKGLGG